MNSADKKRLRKSIRRLTDCRKITNEKHIFIFGISDRSREIIRILRETGFKISGIIDNDRKKEGLYFMGIRTLPLSSVSDIFSCDNLFMIYSGFWREMAKQLVDSGIKKKNILVFRKDKYQTIFCVKAYQIYKGSRIYKNIVKKCGDKCRLFLCPYTGTGDIYLIGTLLKQYCEKNAIENYALIVVSAACSKVAQLFSDGPIVKLKSTDECGYLCLYYLTCPEECRITILNDGWAAIHTNPTEWVRGLNGLNFTEMFKRFVFRLPEKTLPLHPPLENRMDEAKIILDQTGLKHHKTVVLSPYSNTLADLPFSIWETLAAQLSDLGFSVCTNSANDTEPPIGGTVPLRFPLNLASQIISAAGSFIGVRSGFCDVISGSNATKIIIYDKSNFFYNCRAYEYFSLKEMGLSNDVIELEYGSLPEKVFIQTIVSAICEREEYK